MVREANSDLVPHGKSQTATFGCFNPPPGHRPGNATDAGATAGPGVTGDDARAYSVTRKLDRDGGFAVLAQGFGLM